MSGGAPGSGGRLVVLASGNGSNLQAILDAIDDGRLTAEVVAVVVNRRAAYALERATAADIATEYLGLRPWIDGGGTRETYDERLAEIVAAHRPDWVVLAGWMHILSSRFLDHFPDRVVNLHPALPGMFPGAHALADALAAHERGEVDHTGIMVHLVPDERVDEGPVLATEEIPIEPGDTLETLAERVHAVEHRLLVSVLADLVTR
ncbi:MAG: phosphoribosylglycinamide formyltransferase [Actinomycetota bacterium]|nr:phosphoribosylglycinamide formyltransferase [Actinomycetota bacterium]